MNKIQKNLTAIEQKFLSLKATHNLYEHPTPIGEVAQKITQGVIKKYQVQDYMKYIRSSHQNETNWKVDERWYEFSMQQMILFLDKVIKYRNIDKPKQSSFKEKLNLDIKKKKTRKSDNSDHQNPYIPDKIKVSSKQAIQNRNTQSSQPNNQNDQNQNSHPVLISSEYSEEYFDDQEGQNLLRSFVPQKNTQIVNKLSLSHNPNVKDKQSDTFLDLPQNFQKLPVQERYTILSKKYAQNKSILQKKFDQIYKHYRKQMYIPYESFQINNQLLMDLRIFLKYYRQFQISKKFKTNQAIKNFKKLALNGLWLDDKQFIQMHYKLVQILDVDESLYNKQLSNLNPSEIERADQLKRQLSKNIKLLIQNLLKINQLSGLVSQQKINSVFNNNTGRKIIKKIVEAHTGLSKEDVMLKLQQRVEQRKNRKSLLVGMFNSEKFGQLSPQKAFPSPTKLLNQKIQRTSPHKISIYQQLEIPKLRSREMRGSSVYESLQILKIHKQKEKLKELINEGENQKYLDAYFKKQKQLGLLQRSNSVTLSKIPTESQESTNSFTVISSKSINKNRANVFQRNFSLPRMKFT